MKSILLTAALLAAALPSAAKTESAAKTAEPDSFPQGYWDRSWGVSPYGMYYQVTLKVKDVDAATAALQKLMKDGGAKPPNCGAPYYGYYQGGPVRRTLQFTAPREKAEELAQKVLSLGKLKCYSENEQNGGDGAQLEIRTRLGYLKTEMTANGRALKGMPIARYFLEHQRDMLENSRDSYERGRGRALINVNLVGED